VSQNAWGWYHSYPNYISTCQTLNHISKLKKKSQIYDMIHIWFLFNFSIWGFDWDIQHIKFICTRKLLLVFLVRQVLPNYTIMLQYHWFTALVMLDCGQWWESLWRIVAVKWQAIVSPIENQIGLLVFSY